jgi:hypothetical protein
MTEQSKALIARLKGLGFTRGNQMKLYGENFEMAGEPLVVTDDLVLVDAIDKRSGQLKRVRIPLPILKMAAERAA